MNLFWFINHHHFIYPFFSCNRENFKIEKIVGGELVYFRCNCAWALIYE